MPPVLADGERISPGMFLIHQRAPALDATPPYDAAHDLSRAEGNEVAYIRTSDRAAPDVDIKAIWARTVEYAAAPLGLTVHEHVRRFVNLLRSPRSNVFVAADSAVAASASRSMVSSQLVSALLASSWSGAMRTKARASALKIKRTITSVARRSHSTLRAMWRVVQVAVSREARLFHSRKGN